MNRIDCLYSSPLKWCPTTIRLHSVRWPLHLAVQRWYWGRTIKAFHYRFQLTCLSTWDRVHVTENRSFAGFVLNNWKTKNSNCQYHDVDKCQKSNYTEVIDGMCSTLPLSDGVVDIGTRPGSVVLLCRLPLVLCLDMFWPLFNSSKTKTLNREWSVNMVCTAGWDKVKEQFVIVRQLTHFNKMKVISYVSVSNQTYRFNLKITCQWCGQS